jgi:hypothetical protein
MPLIVDLSRGLPAIDFVPVIGHTQPGTPLGAIIGCIHATSTGLYPIFHTHDALMDLLPHAPTRMPVICCQNGLANERAALRHFSNVYAMAVMLPATHLNPGEILHYSTTPGGVLDCGRYPTRQYGKAQAPVQ